MPYVTFKYIPGDSVYAAKGIDLRICPISTYVLIAIKTASRKHNINYYRLDDDRIFDENSLMDEETYQEFLAVEKEQSLRCLEAKLLEEVMLRSRQKTYALSHDYYVEWELGDIAYIKEKAQQGEMIKVCIKECMYPECIQLEYADYVFKDTFNGLWLTEELVSYEDARQLADEYLNARIAALE